MSIPQSERLTVIEEANVNLTGWLQRMFNIQLAAQEGAEGWRHVDFGGWQQTFPGLPKDASLQVRPSAGLRLEGEEFDSLMGTKRSEAYYRSRHPFRRGAILHAAIYEVDRKKLPEDQRPDNAQITMDLHCLHKDPTGVPSPGGVVKFNYNASGVLVPADAFSRVEITVVDELPSVDGLEPEPAADLQ